jgi:hypothetical protein
MQNLVNFIQLILQLKEPGFMLSTLVINPYYLIFMKFHQFILMKL